MGGRVSGDNRGDAVVFPLKRVFGEVCEALGDSTQAVEHNTAVALGG